MCTWSTRSSRWACTQVWNKVNHGLINGRQCCRCIVDGNVASKARDVVDNGGMTCGGEVSRVGGVEYVGGMKLWEGDVEYSCGMEVSRVAWNTQVV